MSTSDLDYWQKICAVPHYGFIHSPDNSRVLKVEGIGNWIDMHDAQDVVGAAQSEINALRRTVDELRHRPSQTLLEALVEQLQDSGAVNYQENVFDLDVGSDRLEASVILRHRGRPGPHELRMTAEREIEMLRAALTEIMATATGEVKRLACKALDEPYEEDGDD